MLALKKEAMCGKKATFTTKGKAEQVAAKFGQRVYECPVCFCWHATSKENWKYEYVTRVFMEQEIVKVRTELNEKNRKLSQEIFSLQKRLKQEKAMTRLTQEQINSMFEARIARIEKYLHREGHDITKYDGPETLPAPAEAEPTP